MRKHAFLFLLLSTTCWSACQELPPEWPAEAWAVLPSLKLLEAGVVNKYYFHYISTDKYKRSTDIRYYAYELIADDKLRLTIYDPGLLKLSEMDYTFDEQGMHCTRSLQYWRGEPQPTELIAGEWLDWTGNTTLFSVVTQFGEIGSEYLEVRQRGAPADTIILDQAAKRVAFQRQHDYTYTDNREANHYESAYTDYYVAGLGLLERRFIFADATGQLELVKQLSAEDFEELRTSVPKRVAYIDPDLSLDRYGYFQICSDNPDKIFDYYNGEIDAGFKIGKRALENALRAKIEKRFLAGESGYLTFRFVVNCEGETGWFITEQADLNFQSKAFSPGTVQHVYDILKGLRNWQPAIVRGEVVDAYAYVTLKISNGELIDILP